MGGSTTSSLQSVNVEGDVAFAISLTRPANGGILLGESSEVPGAYSIRAVLTDNVGDTIESAPISILVNPVTLTIDASINNSIVNDDNMLVSGTFIAPPNSGVTVNGMLAILFKNTDGSYSYYANNVPLNLGNNTITVTLVSQDGQTASTSASVTSTGSPGFKITADRLFDILPNGKIDFTYQNSSVQIISTIQVDYNADGIVDYTYSVTPEFAGFSLDFSGYSSVSKWPVIIKLLDANNNVIYATTQVIIMDTKTAQNTLVKQVITSMFGQLKQGNVTSALQSLSSNARTTYSGIFNALTPYMSALFNDLSSAVTISNDIGMASYAILRAEGGVNKIFIVNMIKGSDGVWRIDSL